MRTRRPRRIKFAPTLAQKSPIGERKAIRESQDGDLERAGVPGVRIMSVLYVCRYIISTEDVGQGLAPYHSHQSFAVHKARHEACACPWGKGSADRGEEEKVVIWALVANFSAVGTDPFGAFCFWRIQVAGLPAPRNQRPGSRRRFVEVAVGQQARHHTESIN
ncbi:hypothetical protein L209DRAFT_567826 [Thermothelomyces heterothallicus CBS 203.75]